MSAEKRTVPGFVWAIAALLSAALLCLFPVHGALGSDIFWHLKTGEWILQNHQLPGRDIFTWTLPPNTAWDDVQWAFQILAALAFRLGGWNALIALRTFFVETLAVILWFWQRERAIPAFHRFLTITAIVIGCHSRLQVRPELFNFVFLAASLWLYDRAWRRQKIELFKLALVQWAWANTHSSCILGIALGGLFAAWHISESRGKNWKTPAALALLLPAVSLINPNFTTAITYALTEGHKTFISEFKPPGWMVLNMAGTFVLLLALPGFRRPFNSEKLARGALTGLFFAQTLRMIRFMPNAVISAASALSDAWAFWLPASAPPRTRLLRGTLAAALFSYAAYCGLEGSEMFRLGVNLSQSPVAPADYLETNHITGRLFNTSNDGSYLLWRLAPTQKVFAFNDTHLCAPLLELPPAPARSDQWEKFFADYQFDIALVPADEKWYYAEGKTVAEMIRSMPGWALVSWDDHHLVFLRNTPAFAELIQRDTCALFPETIPYLDSPSASAEPLQRMAPDPARREALRRELTRALESSPDHFRAALGLALLFEVQGDPARSLQYYTEAGRLQPDNASLLAGMGRYWFSQRNPALGLQYFAHAAKIAPGNAGIVYNFALAQSRSGQNAAALETLARLLASNPDFAPAVSLQKALKVAGP